MNKKCKYPLIFIMGNTATNKSNILIYLKKKYYKYVEIINVDSMNIYRDMNIGTAKPNINILKKFPHKLINIRDASQKYSVYNFYNDSIKIIKKSINNNIIPIFSGGSMFYFDRLLFGISFFNNENIFIIKYLLKKIININYKNKINLNFFKNIFNKYDINNNNKILKYIYIYVLQGYVNKNILYLKNKYNIYQYCIIHNNDKKNTLKIIKKRFFKMLYNGFEEEVKSLYLRGDLSINNQSIKSIGYKEMWLYLTKKISYNDMINNSILSTLKLIKKQNKWIKKWNSYLTIYEKDNNTNKKIFKNIKNIINKFFD